MDFVLLVVVVGIAALGLWGGRRRTPSGSTHFAPSLSWNRDRRHQRLKDQAQPVVNVDGTPMHGSLDANGNPYGVTSIQPGSGIGLHGHDFEPAVNIDGSPMIDGIDIHGHPYGVTDSWGGIDPVMSDSVGLSSFESSSCGSSFGSSFGCGMHEW